MKTFFCVCVQFDGMETGNHLMLNQQQQQQRNDRNLD